MAKAAVKPGRVLAIIGSKSQVSRGLYYRLAQQGGWKKIICLDATAPSRELPNTTFYKINLADVSSDLTLVHIFQKENVDTVLHTGFLDHLSSDPDFTHIYESIGTFQILATCAELKIRKLVVAGTSMVYGAHSDNPIYITEDHPLRGDPNWAYIREKVDVEKQVAQFAKNHPDITVTVLRMPPLLGRRADNFIKSYIDKPVVLTIAGYDPLWQLLHLDDALSVINTVLTADIPGVYNFAAPGVLPLSSIIRIMGNRRMPVPHSFLRTYTAAKWLTQLSNVQSPMLEYLKFSCLADCTRAFKLLGLRPERTIAQTLASADE